MLVVLFCLVTFTRAAISYISNNLIGKMMHRIQSNSDDKLNDKEQQGLVPEDNASKSDTKSVAQSKTGSANKSMLNFTAVDGPMSPRVRPRNKNVKSSGDQVKPSTSVSTSSRVKKVDELDGTKTQDAYARNEDENENENENQSSMKQNDSDSEILHFLTPKESSFYIMNRVKHGKCVVFNQMNFDSWEYPVRTGSNYDVDAINKTFSKLGFDVKVHEDLGFMELSNVIAELSSADYSDFDCLCIFMLTHGASQGRVYTRDLCYPFENIWFPFTECPSLVGKPKMFFVQACRGRSVEKGIKGRSAMDSHDTAYSIPTHADFLFGYSTVEGFYSWRQQIGKAGSWYIQSLCQVIDQHWKHTDLVKMLTMVSRKVAFEYESEHIEPEKNKKRQMPTFSSTLTRDIYFDLPTDQSGIVTFCFQHIVFQLSQLLSL